MSGEQRSSPQNGECWDRFVGAGQRLGAGPWGRTLALLRPNLGQVSPRQEGNTKARILSRARGQAIFGVNLRTPEGGKGRRARRSGSSAGCRFSLALPRRPWTDSRCRDKDTGGAGSVRQSGVGHTFTAARASEHRSDARTAAITVRRLLPQPCALGNGI